MELGQGGCWLWGSKVSRLYVVWGVLVGNGMGSLIIFVGNLCIERFNER